MPTSKYWQDRFILLQDAQLKKGEEYAKDLEQQYLKATARMERQIETWYQRFAANNEISLTEAKIMLTGKQLKEFKWDVFEYIKYGEENALDQKWMKELENASARVHISRLDSLKLQMQQQIEVLYGNQLDDVDHLMKGIYDDGFYHTAFEIQRGFNVGYQLQKLTTEKIQAIASKPWTTDNKTFSDRIWGSKQDLINQVHTGLTQGIIRGDSPNDAVRSLANIMKVKKNQAGRLIMTESAFFASAAQRDAFKTLDVEKFEVVATLDNHTSEICQDLDGHIEDMANFEVGSTAPPFHVWCRSTTVPYFDDNFGERAARGADGKTYYVPSDMKYPEWKKSFVDGSPNDESDIMESKPLIKLDALTFPSYFMEKKSKKHTEAFVEYINGVEGSDPDMMKIFNSMDKLETLDSNGIPVKVTYGKASAITTRTSYSGKFVDVGVNIPKLDGSQITGAVQTTAHELGHLIDLYARNGSDWMTSSNASFFSNTDTSISDKMKALFDDYNKKAADVQEAVKTRYVGLMGDLKDKYIEVVRNPYNNITKYKEYTKKQKALINELNEEADFEKRNMMNGVNNLQDIYDALSGGSFRDSGVVKYGHGTKYYRKAEARIAEVWANYSALSITRPDLIKMLAEDKPDLVKLMDEIKEELLKKVGD